MAILHNERISINPPTWKTSNLTGVSGGASSYAVADVASFGTKPAGTYLIAAFINASGNSSSVANVDIHLRPKGVASADKYISGFDSQSGGGNLRGSLIYYHAGGTFIIEGRARNGTIGVSGWVSITLLSVYDIIANI